VHARIDDVFGSQPAINIADLHLSGEWLEGSSMTQYMGLYESANQGCWCVHFAHTIQRALPCRVLRWQ
jgi:hypothetical protein